MTTPSHHQIERAASGLRRAAAEAGVALPPAYARAVAADGLRREAALGVTPLGTGGVVLHTAPESPRRLPVVIGYADTRGQWYRDGRRHLETAPAPAPAPAPEAEAEMEGVAL